MFIFIAPSFWQSKRRKSRRTNKNNIHSSFCRLCHLYYCHMAINRHTIHPFRSFILFRTLFLIFSLTLFFFLLLLLHLILQVKLFFFSVSPFFLHSFMVPWCLHSHAILPNSFSLIFSHFINKKTCLLVFPIYIFLFYDRRATNEATSVYLSFIRTHCSFFVGKLRCQISCSIWCASHSIFPYNNRIYIYRNLKAEKRRKKRKQFMIIAVVVVVWCGRIRLMFSSFSLLLGTENINCTILLHCMRQSIWSIR